LLPESPLHQPTENRYPNTQHSTRRYQSMADNHITNLYHSPVCDNNKASYNNNNNTAIVEVIS
jgi:hypothetical protein